MPEFAKGGIVERGEVGEHGDLIPAILSRDCCTYLWPAADAERGLLDRINRQEPQLDVEAIEQRLVDAITETAKEISRALLLPSFAAEAVEILRPQLHDIAVSLAQKLNEER